MNHSSWEYDSQSQHLFGANCANVVRFTTYLYLTYNQSKKVPDKRFQKGNKICRSRRLVLQHSAIQCGIYIIYTTNTWTCQTNMWTTLPILCQEFKDVCKFNDRLVSNWGTRRNADASQKWVHMVIPTFYPAFIRFQFFNFFKSSSLFQPFGCRPSGPTPCLYNV